MVTGKQVYIKEHEQEIANTFIKPSTIHGLGLFAMVDIPKGEEIIQGAADFSYTDEWIKYTKTQKVKSFSYHKGYCMINHSKRPNTARGNEFSIIAAKRIPAGEEITEDYYALPDEQNPFTEANKIFLAVCSARLNNK